MKKPSLAQKIAAAIINDKNDEGRTMDLFDIAEEIFGDGFHVAGADIQDQIVRKIRTNMGYAMEIAMNNGHYIIPKRKETQNDPKKKFMILGWKVLTPSDEGILVDEYLFKNNRKTQADTSLDKLVDNAEQKGLILPQDLLMLDEYDSENEDENDSENGDGNK